MDGDSDDKEDLISDDDSLTWENAAIASKAKESSYPSRIRPSLKTYAGSASLGASVSLLQLTYEEEEEQEKEEEKDTEEYESGDGVLFDDEFNIDDESRR